MLLNKDLKQHNEKIADKSKFTMTAVIESGWYFIDQKIRNFEIEFAEHCGPNDCLGQ